MSGIAPLSRRADPFATLLKLRRASVEEARRDLADALAGAAARAREVREAFAALEHEADTDPALYAAWLPRGIERAVTAAARAEAANRAVESARLALAEARAAERAVEAMAERRAAEAARRRTRKQQAALDEAAQRRPR